MPLLFIQVPSPYSLKKYEEPISLENFYGDILELKGFSPVFTIFVKSSENINLSNLSQKKLKYSSSVLWIHDFIYELNLATTHVVDGHEIGRGLEVLPLACEQALHLRESREVTRGRHTVAALSRVLSRLASLAIQEELANRLILPHFS